MSELVTAILELAVRIGKAIARRLARWSLRRVVTWMRDRVERFRRLRAEANTDRRRAWLAGRIERWTNAADWLEANAMKALGTAARDVCRLKAFHKLPDWAHCETAAAA